MQMVENNKIKGLVGISEPPQDFQLWQENKYLVLRVNKPVAKIELPPYCIKCGQPVTELTEHLPINLVTEKIITSAVVMTIIILLGVVSSHAISNWLPNHTIAIMLLIAIAIFTLGGIIYSYKRINKSSTIKLYYGLCQQHANKLKKTARLINILYFLSIIIVLAFMYIKLNPWLFIMSLIILIKAACDWLNNSLALYKTQTRSVKETKVDFYLSGCRQAFFDKLTLAIKDN